MADLEVPRHNLLVMASNERVVSRPNRLSQGLDAIVPTNFIQEDAFAPLAPAPHVIHRAGVLRAQVAKHRAVVGFLAESLKTKKESRKPKSIKVWVGPIDGFRSLGAAAMAANKCTRGDCSKAERCAGQPCMP